MDIFREVLINDLSKEQLLERLGAKGVQFNEYAKVLFEHPSFAPSGLVERLKLVKVNLLDLKLTKPSVFQDIVSRAGDEGLILCPLHLGAYLRLEYLDQPEGPYLTVASAKPGNDESYPNGFYLRNIDGSLWLRGYRATDDWEYAMDMEFVFRG